MESFLFPKHPASEITASEVTASKTPCKMEPGRSQMLWERSLERTRWNDSCVNVTSFRHGVGKYIITRNSGRFAPFFLAPAESLWPSATKWMVTNGYEWLQMVTNGCKWLQMVTNQSQACIPTPAPTLLEYKRLHSALRVQSGHRLQTANINLFNPPPLLPSSPPPIFEPFWDLNNYFHLYFTKILEHTNERTNKRMNQWTNKRTNKRTNKQMNEWTNELMNERTNEQTNKQMNERTDFAAY